MVFDNNMTYLGYLLLKLLQGHGPWSSIDAAGSSGRSSGVSLWGGVWWVILPITDGEGWA